MHGFSKTDLIGSDITLTSPHTRIGRLKVLLAVAVISLCCWTFLHVIFYPCKDRHERKKTRICPMLAGD